MLNFVLFFLWQSYVALVDLELVRANPELLIFLPARSVNHQTQILQCWQMESRVLYKIFKHSVHKKEKIREKEKREYVHVCGCLHATIWESEDNFQELVFSFHHVGTRD